MKQFVLGSITVLLLCACSSSPKSEKAAFAEKESRSAGGAQESSVSAVYLSAKGDTLRARFTGSAVTAVFPDGSVKTYHQAVSASGARYTDSTGEFWEHQGEAVCSENDSVIFIGKSAAP